jgi:hypothetical protein
VKNGPRISKPRLLDKGRALWRRECKRDPSLPPLLSVAGKVEVKGAVRVVLPIVGGKAVVVAHPIGGWRFELVQFDFRGAAPAAAPAQPTATFETQTHDTVVDLIVDLERRMLAFEAKHHLPNNVANIAAE